MYATHRVDGLSFKNRSAKIIKKSASRQLHATTQIDIINVA
jgi:hypothetical protein